LADGSPGELPCAVATAKVYAFGPSREVANRGVQVHGGIGFTWEHDLHLYYKRSKASEILFGDAGRHRGGTGRSGFWRSVIRGHADLFLG
jgi:alkylation response protein AidB-like acyl-CoA dehydrogenase